MPFINLAIFCGAILVILVVIYYFEYYWQGGMFDEEVNIPKGMIDSPGENTIQINESIDNIL